MEQLCLIDWNRNLIGIWLVGLWFLSCPISSLDKIEMDYWGGGLGKIEMDYWEGGLGEKPLKDWPFPTPFLVNQLQLVDASFWPSGGKDAVGDVKTAWADEVFGNTKGILGFSSASLLDGNGAKIDVFDDCNAVTEVLTPEASLAVDWELLWFEAKNASGTGNFHPSGIMDWTSFSDEYSEEL